MRRAVFVLGVLTGLIGAVMFARAEPSALAHCEVPCGIYTDHARVNAMLEDTMTIAKAIDQINTLAGSADAQSINQAVRWVNTKEDHATKIQQTIAQYFLTQRVKPAAMGTDGYDAYVTSLTEHHAVMVAAMKAKQTTDPMSADTLREAIETIAKYYPEPHDHDHGG